MFTADHVFNGNHQLLPLIKVEAYIKKHQQLPNIPSEKQVKQNDINVAEMNAKLLEKIEELTLYVIEQQKRIEKLEMQLNK